MSDNQRTLLSISEVCEALNIHPRTLWLLRKQGKFIEPVMLNSVIRFDPDDLAAWIEGAKA